MVLAYMVLKCEGDWHPETWRRRVKNSRALQIKNPPALGRMEENMNGMITMYDASDKKLGETFFRRAKQLVKQQRATWTTDEQKAIKFLEGTESMAVELMDAPDEEWIYELAVKRIKERKFMKWHTILFVPGVIITTFAAAIVHAAFRGDAVGFFFMGFLWGFWGTAYAIHVYYYFKKYPLGGGASKAARRERELAAEIAAIKSGLVE